MRSDGVPHRGQAEVAEEEATRATATSGVRTRSSRPKPGHSGRMSWSADMTAACGRRELRRPPSTYGAAAPSPRENPLHALGGTARPGTLPDGPAHRAPQQELRHHCPGGPRYLGTIPARAADGDGLG